MSFRLIWGLAKPFLPYIIGALAILGIVLWIRGMQAKIEQQNAQINTLAVNLKAEQLARAKDIAGLTVLSSGLLAASSAKDKDQKALMETIDVAHPTPVSPGLAALFRCLHEADTGRECPSATGTGSAPPKPAAGSK